ncbi:glycosyltransferase [Pseudomonas helleri]|uniref:glycosyltransferase n=1 Tax=Pseudomonas helleri TaxID=1608996 RepID=UPI0028EEC49C|nr:glycosyltransferase [Pseudomonas helleri]
MKPKKTLKNNQIEKIIFWDPCLSPHKAIFFESFASLNPNLEIVCCADQTIPDSRKKMGWTVSEPIKYKNIISPDKKTITSLITESPSTTLHVFSGIRWIPTIIIALEIVKNIRAPYIIMSEPRVIDGFTGKLRLIQSWLTERYHRQNAAAILAIGRNGPPWFIASGYSKSRVLPFAYFVPPPLATPYKQCNTDKTRVGYLGRLIKMKGVLDVVNSVSGMNDKIALDFAGNGPEEDVLKSMCISAGIEHTFRGVIPITETGNFFSNIDILILASTSKDDGWGVVISEALMAGVTVIATPMVGASILLDNSLFGRCVPAHNPEAIKSAIYDLIKSDEFTPKKREARAYLANKILSAHAGAVYFMKIIDWLEGRSERPQDFYSLTEYIN